MLKAQEIANYVTEELEKESEQLGYNDKFSIEGEIASGYHGNKINGMVRTFTSEMIPSQGNFFEAKYVFIVDLMVYGTENQLYSDVSSALDGVIQKTQAKTVEFNQGRGVVTFTGGVPKNYKIAYGTGEGVPLSFTVSVTYTQNSVTSSDKHWLLDGTEIPFLSESVSVETEGIPKKIYDEAYGKTLITKQTKYYSFSFPYESAVYRKLQAEILNSAHMGIIHTLSYYDGAAFTKENPFTTSVCIYRSAKSSSSIPNGSVYEVTFSDVYNAQNKPLQYFISLIDFPFDMQGEDTRYFKSTAEQTQYFEAKAAASTAPFVEVKAPNLDNLIITQQVYYNPNANAVTQFDYASKNYAVIKVVSPEKTYYFYYFIEKADIGADGFVLCDLRLDTVQTYFFDPNIKFSDCLIERAHLNRFEEVAGDPTKVKFISDPASKIFNAEDGLSFPKRLVDRQKLNLRFTGNDIVDNWLNENVAYWVYVFIDPTAEYKVVKPTVGNHDYTTIVADLNNGGTGLVTYPIGMDGATYCFCYPIYKNSNEYYPYVSKAENVIKFAVTTNGSTIYIIPDFNGRSLFESVNNDKSYYYSIKVSILPPFTQVAECSIDNKNNLVFNFNYNDGKTLSFSQKDNNGKTIFRGMRTKQGDDGTPDSFGVFWGSYQQKTIINTGTLLLWENAEISKFEITALNKPSLKFNPKLNGQNFKSLIISASSGDTFTYDIQKLVENSVTFEYSEPITPEVTKYYMRVKGSTGLYEDGTDENYTGLVGSTDNGLAFTNDQYAAFIANNKNFYLQSNMKIITGALAEGGISGAGKVFRGEIGSGLKDIVSSGIKAGISAMDRSLTVDNLKNAPDQLKNANGNVIFNLFSTELGLYAEIHEALEGDLKTANDFMNIYGFTFNSVANIRDYVNIRKYHNYVKAQLQNIDGNLSNAARQDLRQRFDNGVRFWNGDSVEYQYENYELWLDN